MDDMAMLEEIIGMGGSIEGTLSGVVETEVAEMRLVSLSALLAAAGLLRFLIQFYHIVGEWPVESAYNYIVIVSVTMQDYGG